MVGSDGGLSIKCADAETVRGDDSSGPLEGAKEQYFKLPIHNVVSRKCIP